MNLLVKHALRRLRGYGLGASASADGEAVEFRDMLLDDLFARLDELDADTDRRDAECSAAFDAGYAKALEDNDLPARP